MGNEELKGNQCITDEQARAIGDFADCLAGLSNDHGIHPCYLLGVIESFKFELLSQAHAYLEERI